MAMARSPNQKLKLLYLMDYLLRHSDESHPVTIKDMIAYLARQDVSAERKSLYDDMEALRTHGLDIIQSGGGYYVASRTFELPELKLLVDSVQSSKFITHSKTAELIAKIETLASEYDARLLQRQVYVTGRVKTMNESIYYNVDAIHLGITHDRQIRFQYFEYTVTKERRFRKDGAFYQVSPYALTWDNENYYLVAYDGATREVRHYRVDKMTAITTTDAPREGKEAFASADMAAYARKVFGMFSGEETSVQLRLENHLVGAVLDRLGRDVMLIPDGPHHFTVRTNVVVSPQFFAWLAGFGAAAQILAPAEVRTRFKHHLQDIVTLYEEENDHE